MKEIRSNIYKFGILLISLTLLSSCGLFKHKTKKKDSQSIEVSIKKDSVETSSKITTGKVESKEFDKGVVTTETETTTVTKKEASKTNVTVNNKDLVNGVNILKDSLGKQVILVLDSLKNTLTIQVENPAEETVTTKKEKKTEQKNSSREERRDSTTNIQKQVAVTNQEDRDINNIQTYSESKSDLLGTLMFWIGIGICIVVIGFGLKKFVFKK